MDSYETASDIYQSLPDWMPIYPLYTTTFAGIPGNTTWISHFSFLRHLYLAPEEAISFY